jgi:hypothetical protein
MNRPNGTQDPEEVLSAMASSAVLPSSLEAPALPRLALREVWPWALFGLLLAFGLLYLVGAEQGVVSIVGGSWVHEFVHDGRHLMSFPCH